MNQVAGGSGVSTGTGDDLSALAWVHDELRRSLETAHKALRRHLREVEAVGASDVDTADPAVLRSARMQIHQSAGALELVGLTEVAEVLRAGENLISRLSQRPQSFDLAAVETVERLSFAVLDFIGRHLAGKPVSPVMLFPQYRAAQQLAGADRVHPADLWRMDFQWRELPHDASARALPMNDAARGQMEGLTLALMRQPDAAAVARMSDLCAGLAAGTTGAARTLWQLAAGVFDAQAAGALAGDVYIKRLASRLLTQLRMAVRGQSEVSERLAQDLLFFCAHARPTPARPASRLDAVREAWRLPAGSEIDYETPRLGRFDPAQIAQAKKRVASAKDNWSAVAGGDMHRASALNEQFTLVGDSLTRLMSSGDLLGAALQAAVAPAANAGQVPGAPLAMEVATAILYVDATIEDGELDHPDLAARIRRLAKRIDDVRIGVEAQPLEPWMEELYRRVSDRQTMGSVVQELRSSLSEVEKHLDQYFRNPAERQVLIGVPNQLSSMRGVLSVLGLDQASAAVLHMRDDIDALANTEVDPQRARETGTFDRVADNLGTLGFLIDMLSVQPALAKSLFRFDAVTGNLSAVMGQTERPSAFLDLPTNYGSVGGAGASDGTGDGDGEASAEAGLTVAGELPSGEGFAPLTLEDYSLQVGSAALDPETGVQQLSSQLERLAQRALTAEQPGLARIAGDALDRLRRVTDEHQRRAVRTELARNLAGLAPPPLEPLPASAPVPAPRAAAAAGGTGLEDDAEMRGIFIEEAREVLAEAHAALEHLAEAPDNSNDMTALRRAFHTLKGSSRMVGLNAFGEAAWSCEQLYNARLAQSPRMDVPLRELTQEALQYLSAWVEAIAAGRNEGHRTEGVAQAADTLRLQGRRVPITAPEPPTVPGAASARQAREEVTTIALPRRTAGDAVLPEPRTVAMPARPTAAPGPAAPPPLPRTVALPHRPDGSTPSDLPKTEALPPRDVAPDSGFGFTLDLSETPQPIERTAIIQRLTEQVPELPSAQDLDLRARPTAPRLDVPLPTLELPASVGGSDDDDSPLDFDLPSVPGALAPSSAPPSALLPEPSGPAAGAVSAPVPLPATEVAPFDLDLGSLDDEPAAAALHDASEGFSPSRAAPLDVPAGDAQTLDIDSDELERVFAAAPLQPLAPAAAHAAADAAAAAAAEEPVKVIGPLRISIPLFNIFLNEADELSRRLVTELAEWGVEAARHPVPDSSVALAHSLAGNSATVGYTELSALSRALEHALARSHAAGRGRRGEAALFSDAADEIRRLLHQFAAGFLPPASPPLMERLAEHEHLPEPGAMGGVPGVAVEVSDFLPLLAEPEERSGARADAFDDDEDIDAVDAVDEELFPVFDEEAAELLPQLQERLREWHEHPGNRDAPSACMRTLHTLKGGARLAGAMRLGEMAHRLETAIEHLAAHDNVHAREIHPLLLRSDRMAMVLEALHAAASGALPPEPLPDAPALRLAARAPEAAASPARAPAPGAAPPVPAAALAPPLRSVPAVPDIPAQRPLAVKLAEVAEVAEVAEAAEAAESAFAPARATAPAAAGVVPIDWQRFRAGAGALAELAERALAGGGAAVRVRAGLLDRLVSHAGEVSITRERISVEMKQLSGSLGELTDSLDRMRRQLRDIEVQAEVQIGSRLETARAAGQAFDPLEMDRFTRFQELTRFMAESVNDVATLQRSVQRTLQTTEDELAAQARLTRELQDDLLRTRMVEFESAADRLYRTVRQAGKETGKQVRLDIVGGAIELDRGVLERMVGPFEHLLRNSVVHGIETPGERTAAGKDATGRIVVQLAQAGNEVAVEFGDDGGGFDYERIRARAEQRGLMSVGQTVSDAELAQLVFAPGFSTAETVSELAGRGVGLDVVRAEVNAMGGRIETTSARGQGTRFRLLLPLTTAVTQVVNMRCGEFQVAVPSTLVEVVKRVPRAETEASYTAGVFDFNGERVPFFWLAALLQAGTRGDTTARSQTVVVIRSAAQRVAIHVDEVMGNQEVVVKNVGPQLARLPGLVGVTLLPSGAVALIYNPVALAAVYTDSARSRMSLPQRSVGAAPEQVVQEVAPLVLVVDDSLTVRRVTQRLLTREGYRVVTAKDGLEALERLAEERPVVVLSDIEMPRMDGFDLVRNIRADARLADLTVIMITSRIAQKHRDYAVELGVDHYLGKPYAEDDLLSLVARYAHGETLV